LVFEVLPLLVVSVAALWVLWIDDILEVLRYLQRCSDKYSIRSLGLSLHADEIEVFEELFEGYAYELTIIREYWHCETTR
jgi:predicted aldo/keto reductase-like oxidoreductase